MKRAFTHIAAVVAVVGFFGSVGPSAWADDLAYPGDYFGRVDLPLPQAFSNLKRLIGDTDNFEPITRFSENNRYRVMAAPIGRLDLLVEKDGKKNVFLCTGWLISAEYIMTNNHCIPGHEGKLLKAQLVMNYLEEGKADQVEKYPVDVAPVETDTELDYSIVRVQGNPGAKFGVIPLLARDPVPNEELFIIQHPAGTPKRLTRRNCRVAPTAERPTEMNHFCDTLGGSSGSPVFSDNDMALLGLHFAGIEKKVNFAKRMTAVIQRSPILSQLQPKVSGPSGNQGRGTPSGNAGSGSKPPAERTPPSGGGSQGQGGSTGGLQPIF